MIQAGTTQSVGISSADDRSAKLQQAIQTNHGEHSRHSDYGDIILVVGSDKTKLLVKSMLLRAASNPFSAMLGPN
ncbi:unnamed protein product [Fusarium fujikuroi]|uniref:BTB domain-containing protein n=1 Tax=Fusarium fujikuroi TaxID=5127 RepID=A0A9Q9UID3_FUSFU|nr:unnamed protein product [Fusarium fujikuroi]VTT81955.1 unnamed protein product [Fusarium fujikuroi]VZI19640.1 unnamed protein product [Fusarium fujikuroi]